MPQLHCDFPFSNLDFLGDTLRPPGLDTLEENEEKNKFFAELEEGKDSPVDYSELNKKLSDTRQNLATDTR